MPHHLKSAGIRVGRIGMAAQSEPRRGQRKHAAELTAAEDSDGRVWLQYRQSHARASRGRFATALLCRARQASSLFASLASDVARTAAARSAALTAPGLPIARVPTGTPAGICMMESRLSFPSSACVFIGTPRTGSEVSDAVMPGR